MFDISHPHVKLISREPLLVQERQDVALAFCSFYTILVHSTCERERGGALSDSAGFWSM